MRSLADGRAAENDGGLAIAAASLIATAQPAATQISVYAAGSLRSALLDAARAFEAAHPGTRLRSATHLSRARRTGMSRSSGLAEVDPHFGRAPLRVVWNNADGSALRPGVGPVQLINAGESRLGRWVRQLEVPEVKALR